MSGGEPAKAGFGFKIQGKARAKVAVNVEEKQGDRQLITGVTGSVIQTAEPSAEEKRQYVIPKLENTYKAGVGKFTPTFVPESSSAAVTGKAEDRYERAAAPDQPALTSYGLQLREPKVKIGAAEETAATNGDAATGPMVPAKGRVDEAQQLRADLEALPDEATAEEYEAIPVEEFGKALLRGLGWSDGQGVGRKRQVVEPKQIIKRPDRLGLGANPAAPPPDKRPRKMGDKAKQDLVAAPAADGTVRHRVGLDEKLVPRESVMPGPAVGKTMAVTSGRHVGLLCVVKEMLPPPEASSGPTLVCVELQPSHEVVEVTAEELGEKGELKAAASSRPSKQQQELGSSRERPGSRAEAGDRNGHRSSREDRHRSIDKRQEHSRGRGEEEQQHHSSSGSRHRKRSSSHDRDRDRSSREAAAGHPRDHSRQQRQQPMMMPPLQLWLASLIRVRVVDKRLQGGKLYLKKGVVLDVAPDGSCDLRMEDSRQVVNVHQDQLETVVPKDPGAAVMVVQGKHKGRKGRLLQVSLSSGAAALQLVGDMEVVRLMLDDVAQFMGQLEEEED